RPGPALFGIEPLNGAARDVVALAAQSQPHLARPEPGEELLLGPFGRDQLDNLGIAQVTPRRSAAHRLVVRARGDLDAVLGQHATDRLDRELLLAQADVVDQDRKGRSRSAVNKADALLRISFARRSSATSFFSSRISAISSLVLPGRAPPSTSACRSHLRNDSGEVIPSLPAIERIASYSLPYSALDS